MIQRNRSAGLGAGLTLAVVAVVAAVAALGLLSGHPPDASAGAAEGTLFGAAYQGQNGPATLYTIDPATGVATEVGPIGFERCGGMDFDSSGTLYATCELPNGGAGVDGLGASGNGSDPSVLITIDPATGQGTEVGPTGIIGDLLDVSFRNSDGALFFSYIEDSPQAAGGNGGCVLLGTIDTGTGAASPVGNTDTCAPGNGLAFSLEDTLFFTNNTPALYTLDQSTGQATQVAPHTFDPCVQANGVSVSGKGGDRMNAMEVQPGSGVLFGSYNAGGGGGGPNCLATVNTSTGDVTTVGESVDGLDAIAFTPELTADLEITKTAGPDQVDVGGELTYTITVTNNGPADATNVVVSDPLPASADFVSVETTQGDCAETDGTVTCELGSLANGATATIEIVVTPTEEGDLENTATVASDQSDPDEANNAAVAGFVVGVETQPTATATPAELPDTGAQPDSASGFPWLAMVAAGLIAMGAGGVWLRRARR